jgi:hypothetical protein
MRIVQIAHHSFLCIFLHSNFLSSRQKYPEAEGSDNFPAAAVRGPKQPQSNASLPRNGSSKSKFSAFLMTSSAVNFEGRFVDAASPKFSGGNTSAAGASLATVQSFKMRR